MKKNKIVTVLSLLLSVLVIGGIVKIGNDISNKINNREDNLNAIENKLDIKEKMLKLDIKFIYENFEPDVDENGLEYWMGDIYFQVNNFYSNFKYEDIESITLSYSNSPEPESFKKHDILEIREFDYGDYFNIYFARQNCYVGEHYFSMSLKMKNYDTPLISKSKIEIV